MHWYKILETDLRGPIVQILFGANIIDECGPWANLTDAINWAEQYTSAKNEGLVEPTID